MKKYSLFSLALVMMTIFGCLDTDTGKDDNDILRTLLIIGEIELQGTWSGECINDEGNNKSLKVQYIFKGYQGENRLLVYNGLNCEKGKEDSYLYITFTYHTGDEVRDAVDNKWDKEIDFISSNSADNRYSLYRVEGNNLYFGLFSLTPETRVKEVNFDNVYVKE